MAQNLRLKLLSVWGGEIIDIHLEKRILQVQGGIRKAMAQNLRSELFQYGHEKH